MYLLFSMQNCNQCKRAKENLIKNGMEFKEIDIKESDENIQLARKYNVRYAGTIINDQTGLVVLLN